jgi:hypothetical protein
MSLLEERLGRALPGGLNDGTLCARLLRGMHSLPEATAHSILDDFERALTRNDIRNPAAYLSTAIQRTLATLEEEKANPDKGVPPALALRLQLLYSTFCKPDDIDRRCKEILGELDEANAIRAIDELGGNDRASIKNLSAFFIRILQKYMKPSAGAAAHVAPPAPAGGGGGGLDMDPPPAFLPRDLLFGYGDDEYVPEMPRGRGGDVRSSPRKQQVRVCVCVCVCVVEGRARQALLSCPPPSLLACLHACCFDCTCYAKLIIFCCMLVCVCVCVCVCYWPAARQQDGPAARRGDEAGPAAGLPHARGASACAARLLPCPVLSCPVLSCPVLFCPVCMRTNGLTDYYLIYLIYLIDI